MARATLNQFFNWGTLYFQRFRSVSSWCTMVACKQTWCWRRSLVTSILDSRQQEVVRDPGWYLNIHKKTSKPASRVTHFLQQHHAYSNKATPPYRATLFGIHFHSNCHSHFIKPPWSISKYTLNICSFAQRSGVLTPHQGKLLLQQRGTMREKHKSSEYRAVELSSRIYICNTTPHLSSTNIAEEGAKGLWGGRGSGSLLW